jgi:hypothetical protein
MTSFPSIVEDVAAVGRALARLERARRIAKFRLPETISIVVQLEDGRSLKPPVNVCYILHKNALILHSVRDRDSASLDIREFVELLRLYFQPVMTSGTREIALEPDDADMLRTMVHQASDV